MSCIYLIFGSICLAIGTIWRYIFIQMLPPEIIFTLCLPQYLVSSPTVDFRSIWRVLGQLLLQVFRDLLELGYLYFLYVCLFWMMQSLRLFISFRNRLAFDRHPHRIDCLYHLLYSEILICTPIFEESNYLVKIFFMLFQDYRQ